MNPNLAFQLDRIQEDLLNPDGRISVYEFLQMNMSPNRKVIYAVDQLNFIRNEFSSKNGTEPTIPSLKRLADRLNIKSDNKNLQLLRNCVMGSYETAANAIVICFSDECSHDSTTDKNNRENESPSQMISEINCFIRKKVDNDELKKLIHNFLLSPLHQQGISSQYVDLVIFLLTKTQAH